LIRARLSRAGSSLEREERRTQQEGQQQRHPREPDESRLTIKLRSEGKRRRRSTLRRQLTLLASCRVQRTWRERTLPYRELPLVVGGTEDRSSLVRSPSAASSGRLFDARSVALSRRANRGDCSLMFKKRSLPAFVILVVIVSDLSASFAGAASNPNCTETLNPGADPVSAVTNAPAGSIVCLAPGTYAASTVHADQGTAAQPVTLTSLDPSNPALLSGRFVLNGNAAYLNVTRLKFQWTSASIADAVVLASPHNNFTYNDVNGSPASGGPGTICINGVAGASNDLIDHNLVHDCVGDPLHTQGIYMLGGPGNVISNNWCWNAAARCYQIRGEQGASWHNNVSDASREGYVFGDLTPTGNDVYNNIVGTVSNNSVYTYGSVGSGNSFHDNCISKPLGNNGGVAAANNIVVNVQFVNVAAHDYNLSAAAVNDPCRADAVQGGNPGPDGALSTGSNGAFLPGLSSTHPSGPSAPTGATPPPSSTPSSGKSGHEGSSTGARRHKRPAARIAAIGRERRSAHRHAQHHRHIHRARHHRHIHRGRLARHRSSSRRHGRAHRLHHRRNQHPVS